MSRSRRKSSARAPGELAPSAAHPGERGAGAKDVDVEIREMVIEDLARVFELGERLFRAEESPVLYRTWDEYEVVDYFSSDGEHCLVAQQGERIVGFVIGTIIEKRKSAWTYGYLVWLGVEPELAGQNVAGRLLARITDLFIEAGARMMLVDTDAENRRAISFFERHGFGQPLEHVYLSRNLTTLPGYRRRRSSDESESGS